MQSYAFPTYQYLKAQFLQSLILSTAPGVASFEHSQQLMVLVESCPPSPAKYADTSSSSLPGAKSARSAEDFRKKTQALSNGKTQSNKKNCWAANGGVIWSC